MSKIGLHTEDLVDAVYLEITNNVFKCGLLCASKFSPVQLFFILLAELQQILSAEGLMRLATVAKGVVSSANGQLSASIRIMQSHLPQACRESWCQ